MSHHTLLVVANPASSYLKALERLPAGTHIVAGNQPETFREAGPRADAILNCFRPRQEFRYAWDAAPNVRWVHSLSAGLDSLLFPELVESPVILTNGRGVFSNSLAEFALGGCLFFAKDYRRLLRSQQEGRWDPFDNLELRGTTLGIVGFGTIGQSVARLARAFQMRVLALRRDPDRAEGRSLADQVYGPDGLQDMLSQSDFVVVTSPLTPETHHLINERALRAMKPSAIIINVGRGPVIDEAALIRALRENWIRGAALDVFEEEPLPEGHPFYSMENVFLSPHCADHTFTWLDDAMDFFVKNFERFVNGEALENVVDKRRGY
jgi:phosphoglycerate dehydrogenase-like enzyme